MESPKESEIIRNLNQGIKEFKNIENGKILKSQYIKESKNFKRLKNLKELRENKDSEEYQRF